MPKEEIDALIKEAGRSAASPSVAETFGKGSDGHGSFPGGSDAAMKLHILFGNSTSEA
ncbi:MAG: hypothetical protein V8T16_14750 [Parabacteroides merdae]